MKIVLTGLAVIAAVVLLPFTDAAAHGRHRGISVGVGVGYPVYYRPYGYYSSFYYPRSSIGFNVWPRYRARRARAVDEGEVRNEALYVYPAAGQSEQQLADDRYDCHVWAAEASDYDPTLGAGSRGEAQSYARAFTACMEGRDYVVK
jgi:hypothetical protein